MSGSDDGDGGPGTREVAYRVFAAEYDDATYSYSESDEERAPNYVVSPTGARMNRLFLVGVLTETERVNEEMLRGRIVDPTGAFVVYAGQYQPDELAFLERTDPPAFVAVTGKARTFQPEDSDRVFTSVRPETMSEVDAGTRDRWVVNTAEQTLDRVATMADAIRSGLSGDDLRRYLRERGLDTARADGVVLALDHYGTTPAYLDAVRETALDAVRVVANRRDEAGSLSLAPDGDDGRAVDLDDLAGVDSEAVGGPTGEVESPPTATPDADAGAPTETGSEPDEDAEASAAPGAGSDVEDPGDFEPGEFELDEDTRREVEEEHGVGFETGNEVDEPGEAGIEPEVGVESGAGETPPPSEPAEETEETVDGEAKGEAPTADAEAGEPPAEAEGEASTTEAEAGESPAEVEDEEPSVEAADSGAPDESGGDVDLEAVVVEAMGELDDGDGAAREDVVATVVEEYGVDAGDVEDAIQDALMSGRCYEPGDDRLKPI